MRRAVIIVLAVSLAGCATVRKGSGAHQNEAGKGATIGDSGQPGDEASPAAAAEATGAKHARGKHKKPKPLELPGGLGGDKAHRAYTSDAPPLIPPR